MRHTAVTSLDRRRHPRFENLSLFICDDINAGLCMGRTLDVSQGGVQVETYEPVRPGSEKMFEVVTGSKAVMARGIVVHSRETQPGVYLSGIEFDRLNPDIIRSLGPRADISHP